MSQNAVRENFASLVNGKVPASQLPSYVDDVLEYDSKSAFPATGEEGKIYVDKSTNLTYRWSGSTYIQVGGGDLNVENGTGDYSIRQKESNVGGSDRTNFTYGRANAAFGHKNKTYQRDTFAFGGGNRVGLTYEEWLVLNPGGTQEQYEASYSFSAGFGENNINTGKDSFVFGGSNTNGSNQVFEGGYGNTVDENSEKSQVFGEVNTLQNSPNSVVFGKNNILVNAKNCSAFGYGHRIGSEGVTSAQDSFLAGYNLVNYYSNKIVLGHHNINLSSTLLELGNGNTSANSNAFEVYQDGRAKVYGAPSESNDVVRKKELDAKLNSSEFSVLTQEQADMLF